MFKNMKIAETVNMFETNFQVWLYQRHLAVIQHI